MTKKQATPRLSIAESAAHNEREGLRALRQRLAELIDDPGTPAYAVANLTRQLAAVLRRLADLGEGREHEPPSKFEELRARRDDRQRAVAVARLEDGGDEL